MYHIRNKVKQLYQKLNLVNQVFLSRQFQTQPLIETEYINSKPKDLLNLCLSTYLPSNPVSNDIELLPPNYHLLYFFSALPENELAADGYDTLFSPSDFGFSRRVVWSSGILDYQIENPLKIGQTVKCNISLSDRIEKESLNYGKWIKCVTERIYSNDKGVSLKELRGLTYLSGETKGRKENNVNNKELNKNDVVFEWNLKASPILLFRYSALTFNAHLIHYSNSYASLEGYPDTLIQGPLLITLLLRVVDNYLKTRTQFNIIKRVEYQLLRPSIVNENIKFTILRTTENNKLNIYILGQNGEIKVKAKIVTVK